MEALHPRVLENLNAIKASIQSSPNLEAYLDTEEESSYKLLQEEFEPIIAELHEAVANQAPLQLESFESALLDPDFEGLFLPKALGYAVLRGEVDENYRYRKPQEHFKAILLSICNSANFEILKKRIGQTVQMGFALSSDIWITNLFNSIENKKIKAFLNIYKSDKFRDLPKRKEAFDSYKKQFTEVNFQSTNFPTNVVELKSSFHSIKTFLLYRVAKKLENTGLQQHIYNFVSNEGMAGSKEYFDLFIILGLFFPIEGESEKAYKKMIKTILSKTENAQELFFVLYDELYKNNEITILPHNEQQMSQLVKDCGNDEIRKYFSATDEIHDKGFIHVDSIETVRKYIEQHQGMSMQNECMRFCILSYIKNLLRNFEPQDHADYFELNKIISIYIGMFMNERFNQDVKQYSMEYIQRCLTVFTDKRGKDYQDIKKYVSSVFVDLGFLQEKEVVELFKTRRKKA